MHKMKTEEIKITDLKPYEKNARKNDKAILVVKKSIEKFGFRNPIVVDENNQIVNGHTRFEAAKMIGFKSLPAFRLLKSDGWTETKIKAFRLMDNKSSEFAEWDEDLLLEELKGLKEQGFDIGFTGFDEEDVFSDIKLNEVENVNILDGRANVIMLNPPEVPRLKEKAAFNCESKEDYDLIKDFFDQGSKLDVNKLLGLIR